MSIIKGKTNTVAGVGKNGTGFTLFTPIWQDHLVNNASWLRSDTFSWQSGSVYVAAYNHLIADFNGTTSSEETIGSTTITYYRASDGHKIVLPDQENNVMAIYNTTGIAWYYILDTTNQRFKLPRNKYGFTGFRDNVGNYVAPGLPNITGQVTNVFAETNAVGTGSLSLTNNYSQGNWSGSTINRGWYLNLDASDSNPIYGNSDTVQPPSVQIYLYFFVGNTIEEVTTINIGQLTESLNGKADISLNNVPTNYDYVVESKLPTIDDPTWYRKYKSGWVEQGGYISYRTSGYVQITLLKPYTDEYYSLSGGCQTPDTSFPNNGFSVAFKDKTNTSFYTALNDDAYLNSGAWTWEAKGQGAN